MLDLGNISRSYIPTGLYEHKNRGKNYKKAITLTISNFKTSVNFKWIKLKFKKSVCNDKSYYISCIKYSHRELRKFLNIQFKNKVF